MPRIISRSSIQQYQHCPRSFYHKYFDPAGGPGIESTDRPEYYALGIAFHEGGELLLKGASGGEAGTRAMEMAQQLALPERWQNWCMAACLAWERTEKEKFFETYDVLSVEEEVYVPLSRDVELYGRADAVLQDRETGAIYVWNWKTAADIKDWNKRFFFDIQSWTESIAVGSQMGLDVDGVLYGGVWKGPIWKGYTSSKLVGGYTGSLGGKQVWSPTRSKGLTTRFNAWEETFPFGEGLAAWIDWLPATLVSSHFTTSAPIRGNEEVVEEWVRGIAQAESDIGHILSSNSDDDIRTFFLQHCGDQCARCPYEDICARRATSESLLEEGVMKARDVSHLKSGEAEEDED